MHCVLLRTSIEKTLMKIAVSQSFCLAVTAGRARKCTALWRRNRFARDLEICLPWKLELACVCSLRAKSCEDFTIHVKDLYAMIVRVTNDNSVGIAHSDVMGMLKITRFATHDSKLANK